MIYNDTIPKLASRYLADWVILCLAALGGLHYWLKIRRRVIARIDPQRLDVKNVWMPDANRWGPKPNGNPVNCVRAVQAQTGHRAVQPDSCDDGAKSLAT